MDWRIIRVERTASTMEDAAREQPGAVVVATEQTAGQGRLGRKWHSPPGEGLYCSAVLPIPGAAAETLVVTLALGLAVQEAIQHVTGILADLRWPNDVLLGDRKCAGILVQLHADKIVAGIGLNVNQRSFPAALAGTATSLCIESGRPYDLEQTLSGVLAAISNYAELLEEQGKTVILQLFARASSYVAGRRVVADTAEGSISGVTDGLDENGFLRVRTASGRRVRIRAGGVRPA